MALSPPERSRRMRLNMLMAMSYAVAGRSAFTPLSLFSAGEVGAWYDPSDFSTMFQDSAGTTPVTAVEQPVGLVLDKSRNMTLGSELFSSFATVNSPWTASGSGSWSINGSQGSNTDLISSSFYTTGTFYVTTFTLSGVSGGTVTVFAGEGSGVSLGNGTYTYRRYATQAYFLFRAAAGVSATVSNVSVKVMAGNHASQTTSTSRPVLRQETDGRYYLAFDGTDDFLVTGTINPGSVDKAQVFIGLRKLADTAQSIVFEMSPTIATNNGVIHLTAPNSAAANYKFASKGTSQVDNTVTTYTAPITNVITGLASISGPFNEVRINGASVATVTTSQGTGNYGSYALYIGRRNGATAPFTGHIYGMILRFSAANLSSENITNTETWMNTKTKAY